MCFPDQTDNADERRRRDAAWRRRRLRPRQRRMLRRRADQAARARRGPQERGKGHAEPFDNRRVLRRVLDAAVHHQLRAGVLPHVRRARAAVARVHRPVAPQLGRQPAAVRVPPEGLSQRVPFAAAVQKGQAQPPPQPQPPRAAAFPRGHGRRHGRHRGQRRGRRRRRRQRQLQQRLQRFRQLGLVFRRWRRRRQFERRLLAPARLRRKGRKRSRRIRRQGRRPSGRLVVRPRAAGRLNGRPRVRTLRFPSYLKIDVRIGSRDVSIDSGRFSCK